MRIVRRLADRLVRDHPDRAALVLERHPAARGAALLERSAVDDAAEVLRRLSPSRAVDVASLLPPARSAALLAALDLDRSARILRRLDDASRQAVLDALDERRARSLGALLGFAEGTAGALMDPDVLALPAALKVAEALERLREEPDQARYNLYVVDDDQRLVGVLNLRELLLAPATSSLADLMTPSPLALEADADRARVVSHAGWREVHSLPVVDAQGRYLGAVRYRTLRELEEALLRRPSQEDTPTSRALGELLALGATGALEALTGATTHEDLADER